MNEKTSVDRVPIAAVVMPCPFCGKKVELRFKSGEWGYTPDTVGIRCEPCGIGFIEEAEQWSQDRGTYSIREQAEAKLLIRWNTRFVERLSISGEVRCMRGLGLRQGEKHGLES